MKDNLKPCPFCDSKDLRIQKKFNFQQDGNLKGKPTNVSCMNCFAHGPSVIFDEDVQKMWNQRGRVL